MSKKGAFIYQQIELTTAEWADNATVYPTSVWLFERLENGKFNMKLADGVHTFAQLPAVMQEVKVTVKTNDATTYILTITTAEGKFDTPNLRGNDAPVPSIDPETKHWKIGEEDTGVVAEGQDGESYDDTEIRNALTALQQQVNTLVSGDASSAIESFNEIIAFLASVEDTQTLQGIIAGLNQSIDNLLRLRKRGAVGIGRFPVCYKRSLLPHEDFQTHRLYRILQNGIVFHPFAQSRKSAIGQQIFPVGKRHFRIVRSSGKRIEENDFLLLLQNIARIGPETNHGKLPVSSRLKIHFRPDPRAEIA